MREQVRYSVIVPVFNEEAVIAETYRRLREVMAATGEPYELLFVNDGSRDRTEAIIQELCDRDGSVKLINFSRNFGHQIAITAGMDYAAGDAVVIIDADLQDPPELIPDMIAKWKQGFDVVYATRTRRKGETLFKRQTARLFYRLLKASTDIAIPVDTGDFRLMDRKVCDEMKRLKEQNRFVRGLVSWVGFRQTALDYERDERLAGETKYPLKRMLKLCLDGMTSFSFKPLKLAGLLGGVCTAAGLLYLLALVIQGLAGAEPPGWHYLAVLQLVLSGFILIIMGILGEYVGRIYDESRGRPLYIVRDCRGLRKQAGKVKSVS